MSFGHDGDLFTLIKSDGANTVAVHSGRSDTIMDLFTPLPDLERHHHLINFDRYGVPQWMVRIWHNSTSVDIGDVVVDTDGNVYAALFHDHYGDSLRVYSTDGRHIAFQPPWLGSDHSMIIMSWDPNGLYRWHHTFLEGYGVHTGRLRLDGAGAIYCPATHKFVKCDATTGQQLWIRSPSHMYSIVDLVLDSNNDPWLLRAQDVTLDQYTSAGTLVSSTSFATEINVPGVVNTWIQTDEVVRDAGGCFVITGFFVGRFVLGPDTLDEVTIPSTPDRFICRFKPGTGILWAREVDVTGTYSINHRGLTTQAEHVFALYMTSGNNMTMAGHPPLNMTDVAKVLVHLDTLGGTPRLDPVPFQSPGHSPYIGGTAQFEHSLASEPVGSRIAAAMDFDETLFVVNDTLDRHPSLVAHDFLIALAEPECLMASLPSPLSLPISYFLPPQPSCAGVPAQFTDGSLNGATAWSWQFPGALPSTSTIANPSVIFPTAGTYAVVLQTTNANGTGSVYTDSVFVDICTGVRNENDDQIFIAPNPFVEVLTLQAPTDVRYALYNTMGAELLSGIGRGGMPTRIATGQLAPGAYTILLVGMDGGNERWERVVKWP